MTLLHVFMKDDTALLSASIIGSPDFSKMILLSRSKIFMFDDINLDHLHISIMNADIEALRAAQGNMKMEDLTHGLDVMYSTVHSDMFNNIVLLVSHTEGLASLTLNKKGQGCIFFLCNLVLYLSLFHMIFLNMYGSLLNWL